MRRRPISAFVAMALAMACTSDALFEPAARITIDSTRRESGSDAERMRLAQEKRARKAAKRAKGVKP